MKKLVLADYDEAKRIVLERDDECHWCHTRRATMIRYLRKPYSGLDLSNLAGVCSHTAN